VESKPEGAVQLERWTGDFGREYTDRNSLTASEVDELYVRDWGITRRDLNAPFLKEIPRDARILEVGCNSGNQIELMRGDGFSNIYGIEVQTYALRRAQERMPDGRYVCASALRIPFADRSFDLVFTSGVLIHIAPENLAEAMREIHRCARRYVWGWEYFAPEMTEVTYRGHEELLWKADYAALYQKYCGNLRLVHERRVPYVRSDNVDTMFLLERAR